MFGQYKRIRAVQEGVLTGKGIAWGGSNIRPEATGYGVMYILKHMVEVIFDFFNFDLILERSYLNFESRLGACTLPDNRSTKVGGALHVVQIKNPY